MKQYQYREPQTPALLKSFDKKNDFKIMNGMVEMVVEGERVVLPTAEAFQRLFKQVAILEQRLQATDNKVRSIRGTSR